MSSGPRSVGGVSVVTPRYALLAHDYGNIGDEIQSIAAEQFLPQVDAWVEREALHRPPAAIGGEYKLVLNGWFMSQPAHWPPHPLYRPLITSFHLSSITSPANRLRRSASEVLLTGENLAYLHRHAPIGARDLWTQQRLSAAGVESDLSGCLTLTLGAPTQRRRGNYLCLVDVPDDIVEAVRWRTDTPIVRLTHRSPAGMTAAQRRAHARRLLSLYAHARGVLTTRLHCALPAVAFGTPVFLTWPESCLHRLLGLQSFLHHDLGGNGEATVAAFRPEQPGPNPDTHLACRERLVRTVNDYIGGPAARRRTPLFPFMPVPLLGRDEEHALREAQRHPAIPVPVGNLDALVASDH